MTKQEVMLALGLDTETLDADVASGTAKIKGFTSAAYEIAQQDFSKIRRAWESAVDKPIQESAKKAQSSFGNLGRSIVSGLALGVISNQIRKVVDYVEQLSIRAEALSISRSFLQDIYNVGNASGIATEKVSMMLDRFSKGLSEGSSVEASLMAFADRLKEIEDPGERARMVVERFGRSGVVMLEVLGRGSAGFKAMASEFQKFSEIEIKDLLDADRQLDKLGNTITIWSGKVISAVGSAARVWGEWWQRFSETKNPGDLLFGLSKASERATAGEQAEAARLAGLEKTKAATQAATETEKQRESALKAQKELEDTRFESFLHRSNLETQYTNVLARRYQIERDIKSGKGDPIENEKELLKWRDRLFDLEKQISTEKSRQQDKEKSHAEKMRHEKEREAQKQARIRSLSNKLEDEFMPTLDELADSGIYTGKARRLQWLQKDAMDARRWGDKSGLKADMKEIQQIRDYLKSEGVYSDPNQGVIDELAKLTKPVTEGGGLPIRPILAK